MSKLVSKLRRGAGVGLALLLGSPVAAESWHDSSFVMVTDSEGERRLLIFDETASDLEIERILVPASADRQNALRLLQSQREVDRIRGLTLLAGAADHNALDLAIVSLGDASSLVREEAEQLVADHPLASPALRDMYTDDEDD